MGAKCARVFVGVFTTILSLLSAGAVCAAMLACFSLIKMQKLDEQFDNFVQVVIMVIAVIAFIMMIIIIVGGWISNTGLKVTTMVFLFLIAALFAVVVYFIFVPGDITINLIGKMWTSKHYTGASAELEKRLKCCGYYVKDDEKPGTCQTEVPNCRSEVQKQLDKNGKIVGYVCCVCIALFVVAVILVGLTICIWKNNQVEGDDDYDDEEEEEEMEKQVEKTSTPAAAAPASPPPKNKKKTGKVKEVSSSEYSSSYSSSS